MNLRSSLTPRPMRPMKPWNKPWELKDLRFPVIASPKIDGLRCIIDDQGRAVSNTLKPFPNRYIQSTFADLISSHPWLIGLDGELVVGSSSDPNCMQNSMSGIMSIGGQPDFQFLIFDSWKRGYSSPFFPFWLDLKLSHENAIAKNPFLDFLPQVKILSRETLLDTEDRALACGYEGLILRTPNSPYKFGRSTWNESYMLKMKRYSDAEATILGLSELLHNLNEPNLNTLGYVERSSAQDGKVRGNTLGSFWCENPKLWDMPFHVSPGNLSHAARKKIWFNESKFIGQVITFKHLAHVGTRDRPRHPVFKSFRHHIDLTLY